MNTNTEASIGVYRATTCIYSGVHGTIKLRPLVKRHPACLGINVNL